MKGWIHWGVDTQWNINCKRQVSYQSWKYMELLLMLYCKVKSKSSSEKTHISKYGKYETTVALNCLADKCLERGQRDQMEHGEIWGMVRLLCMRLKGLIYVLSGTRQYVALRVNPGVKIPFRMTGCACIGPPFSLDREKSRDRWKEIASGNSIPPLSYRCRCAWQHNNYFYDSLGEFDCRFRFDCILAHSSVKWFHTSWTFCLWWRIVE